MIQYAPLPVEQLRARVSQVLAVTHTTKASLAQADLTPRTFDFEDGVRIIMTRLRDPEIGDFDVVQASMGFFDTPGLQSSKELHRAHATPWGRPDEYKCCYTIRQRVNKLLRGSGYALGLRVGYIVTPKKHIPNAIFRVHQNRKD